MRLALLMFFLMARVISATDVAEALPLTERWLMIHVDDGHVEHHTKGQKRTSDSRLPWPQSSLFRSH